MIVVKCTDITNIVSAKGKLLQTSDVLQRTDIADVVCIEIKFQEIPELLYAFWISNTSVLSIQQNERIQILLRDNVTSR